jgi:uncharacterized membrane protein
MTQEPDRPFAGTSRRLIIFLQLGVWWLSRFWLPLALLLGIGVLTLALLAPALEAEGYANQAEMVYHWLAPHDHQLPHRSYFLFGQDGWIRSYSLEQVLAWGADPQNLRAFVGNEEIGFKMGLNHRMTAIFVGIVVGGLIWAFAGGRPRVGGLVFLLMALPLLVDGFSHLASDLNGTGYRQANLWAILLTGNFFSQEFYQQSTLGSLNWWLRTATGLMFGLGLVWFLFTYMSYRFILIRLKLEPKLRKAGAI